MRRGDGGGGGVAAAKARSAGGVAPLCTGAAPHAQPPGVGAGGKPTGLPPGWRTAKDESGEWYFYHKVSRVPQWDRPAA